MPLTKMKLVRLRGGLRQLDVAKAAGVAESLLSRLENGHVKPKHTVLQRIADALGVAVADLREESPE